MILPVIYGLSGTTVTDAERTLFRKATPAGFILFKRNCETAEQVAALTADLQAITNTPNIPILIDQEGGRVQRLPWRNDPPASQFAEQYQQDPAAAVAACRDNAQQMAAALLELGINVNCTPVLDLPVDGADPIIGSRAFGTTTAQVVELAQAVIDGHLAAGVLPVIKHIPGHGRATVDSHLALPTLDTPLDTLRNTDFQPFRALNNTPVGMTAHIVYTDIDKSEVATLSKAVINDIIRQELGFDGVLLSDDLNMQALHIPIPGDKTGGKRTIDDLAVLCVQAGCDLALHCSGNIEEMTAITNRLLGESALHLTANPLLPKLTKRNVA